MLPDFEQRRHVDALGTLPSIGNESGRRSGEPASDHAAVTALFEL